MLNTLIEVRLAYSPCNLSRMTLASIFYIRKREQINLIGIPYSTFFSLSFTFIPSTLFIVVSLEDFRCVFIHHMFNLLVFYMRTYAYTFLLIIYICKNISPKLRPRNFLVLLWLLKLVLLISSDIGSNPGHRPSGMGEQEASYRDGFFSFCNWKLNTLSKDQFHRISFLEADNSYFEYDIISLCETSLNEATKVPENIFKGYNFFSQDYPSGEKRVLVYFIRSPYPLD